MKRRDETTTQLTFGGDGANDTRLCLLAVIDGMMVSHPVPSEGTLTIGRGQDCDVRLDNSSVSRRHAELTIGDEILIRDLGSANGTSVGADKLEAEVVHRVGVGEMVRLGSTAIVLQPASANDSVRWLAGSLVERLAEECKRSGRTASPFAFAVVTLKSEADPQHIRELLMRTLRASDMVGATPGSYEVLLVNTTSIEAQLAVNRVVDALTTHGHTSDVGLACYPKDGTSPSELAARARSDLPSALVRTVRVGPAMKELRELMEKVADSDLSVLIRGETGVGKEICAESLHRMSNRSDRPFLRINCAALTESLLESELFGHERGAFTGAHTAKPGLLETADTGTVFLDEIGELPPNLQAKLLRFLEDGVVTRVGGLKRRTINVRFLAATNVEIEAAIHAKTFRADLYYRLAGVTLDIPPLRERVGEIEGLVQLFVERACARDGRGPLELTTAALALLRGHDWPGNIRELRNTVERAVLLSGGATIGVEHINVDDGERPSGTSSLPDNAPVRRAQAPEPPAPSVAPGTPGGEEKELLLKQLAAVEKRELEEILNSCGGNQTRVAKQLGISRTTLQNRMIAHGIPRPRKRSKD